MGEESGERSGTAKQAPGQESEHGAEATSGPTGQPRLAARGGVQARGKGTTPLSPSNARREGRGRRSPS